MRQNETSESYFAAPTQTTQTMTVDTTDDTELVTIPEAPTSISLATICIETKSAVYADESIVSEKWWWGRTGNIYSMGCERAPYSEYKWIFMFTLKRLNLAAKEATWSQRTLKVQKNLRRTLTSSLKAPVEWGF